MAKLVFISHSSHDAEVAWHVCTFLETRGIRCWISSRDIRGGSDWTESIMDAIGQSSVLVLIFSTESAKSIHAQREVQLAFERGLGVIPLRIDDCEPTKKLKFYFTGVQWIIASSRPIEPHLEKLATAVKVLLEGGELPFLETDPGGAGPPVFRKRRRPETDTFPATVRRWVKGASLAKRIRLAVSLLVTACAITGAGLWFLLHSRGGALDDHISTGEKIVRRANQEPDMKSGTEAYRRGDYALAADYFQQVWRSSQNQEALIYYNNAVLERDKIPSCTIAVVIPVSRTGGPSGDEILKGVAQAQNEVDGRDGRIKNGVGLKVSVASDVFGEEDDFSRARQVAAALVADKRVLGVIGHFSSDVTKAVIPIYDGHKALITSTSTAEDLFKAASDPKRQYVFSTVYRDSETATSLVNFLKAGHRHEVTIFYTKGSMYSESLLKQFTSLYAAQGGRLAADGQFDLGSAAFDADKFLSDAKANKSDTLVFFPNSKTIEPALQLLEMARRPEYSGFSQVVSGDSLGYVEALQRGSATEGLISAVPWQWNANLESRFYQDADKLWPGAPVVWQMALSYDAAQAFVAAIASRLPADVDSVQAALAAADFSASGATGKIRFAGGNRVGLVPQLVQIKRTADDSAQFRFFPVPPTKPS